MNRYTTTFAALTARGDKAFVPFVMLGDPNPETCGHILDALVDGGADALELGLPFTDPIADGPAIQQAATRALNAGVTVDSCWDILADFRRRHPSVPVGLLTYAQLVTAPGNRLYGEDFFASAATAGVDSVLVADVPAREAAPFASAAKETGLDWVGVLPPPPSAAAVDAVVMASYEKHIHAVLDITSGYAYVQGRPGVTGADRELSSPSTAITVAKSYSALPTLVGFGISRPAHVRTALDAGADGSISGSAVVGLVEQCTSHAQTTGTALDLQPLTGFVTSMKAASTHEQKKATTTTK